MTVKILRGDCRDALRTLPAESVHCCVTSPPYWGLRDYGVPPSIWGGQDDCEHEWGETVIERATNHTDKRRWQHTRNGRDEEQPTEKRVGWLRSDIPQGQFCQHCGAWSGAHGLEPNYELFVSNEVLIFQEVRRVLRADGTLWLNLGDSYATGAGKVGERPGGGAQGDAWGGHRGSRGGSAKQPHTGSAIDPMTQPNRMPQVGLKAKDLCGVPWRVAFALQADGWYLRQDIIWSKPNPMPESVRDRCTKAHEYLFLLSKSERYYFDSDAIAEQAARPEGGGNVTHKGATAYANGDEKMRTKVGLTEIGPRETRNKRSVWAVPTSPFPEAHFATFPPDLIKPAIQAGCPRAGTVLDPFGGSGTTGIVADRLGRDAILIELNADYADMAARRLRGDGGMFASVELIHAE